MFIVVFSIEITVTDFTFVFTAVAARTVSTNVSCLELLQKPVTFGPSRNAGSACADMLRVH